MRISTAIVTLALLTALTGPLAAQTSPISGPAVNVRDFGAKGDGVTNDTVAFHAAAQALQQAGGGTLVIPKATYIVGLQTHGPTPNHPIPRYRGRDYPYWKEHPIISLTKVNGVVIEGNGATLRIAPGLRFGAYDLTHGKAITETPKKNVFDRKLTAGVGHIINITHSGNIIIRNLELDGNVDHLDIGGIWSSDGRQIAATGIRLYNNTNVRVQNIHTHHHALDGIMIGWAKLTADDPPTPHVLVNVNSEYNSRQGLSWVGGRGLTAINCKFNHTGRAAFGSPPGAGLDIEAEDSVCRDGLFVNCEFINNTGCAVVADSGDGGYTKFINCTFWGTTSWSIWASKPGLKFEDCTIHGAIVHGVGSDDPDLATQYRRCHFEDVDYLDKGCYRPTALVIQNGDNVLFEDCTIVANKTKACYIDHPNREIFRRCTIVHRWTDAPDQTFQSIFRGSHLEDVKFLESFDPAGEAKRFYIQVQGITVGKNVHVAGPQTKWKNWSWGTVGDIPATVDSKH